MWTRPIFFYSNKFVELIKHNKIPMFIVVLKLLQITDPDCYQLVYNNKSVSITTTIESIPNAEPIPNAKSRLSVLM